MKRYMYCSVLALILMLTNCGGPSAPEGGFGDSDFVEVMDSIDLTVNGNTSLAVKTRWAEIEGKQVAWEGEVVDVKGGRRGRVEITVKKDGKPLYKGFNIVVTTYDEATASKLKKGETFAFQGTIENKRQRSNSPVIIYIDNAKILD